METRKSVDFAAGRLGDSRTGKAGSRSRSRSRKGKKSSYGAARLGLVPDKDEEDIDEIEQAGKSEDAEVLSAPPAMVEFDQAQPEAAEPDQPEDEKFLSAPPAMVAPDLDAPDEAEDDSAPTAPPSILQLGETEPEQIEDDPFLSAPPAMVAPDLDDPDEAEGDPAPPTPPSMLQLGETEPEQVEDKPFLSAPLATVAPDLDDPDEAEGDPAPPTPPSMIELEQAMPESLDEAEDIVILPDPQAAVEPDLAAPEVVRDAPAPSPPSSTLGLVGAGLPEAQPPIDPQPVVLDPVQPGSVGPPPDWSGPAQLSRDEPRWREGPSSEPPKTEEAKISPAALEFLRQTSASPRSDPAPASVTVTGVRGRLRTLDSLGKDLWQGMTSLFSRRCPITKPDAGEQGESGEKPPQACDEAAMEPVTPDECPPRADADQSPDS